jgi:hypothetical protein
MQVDIYHYQEMMQHAKTSGAQYMVIFNTLFITCQGQETI